jgi:hypothetical protein
MPIFRLVLPWRPMALLLPAGDQETQKSIHSLHFEPAPPGPFLESAVEAFQSSVTGLGLPLPEPLVRAASLRVPHHSSFSRSPSNDCANATCRPTSSRLSRCRQAIEPVWPRPTLATTTKPWTRTRHARGTRDPSHRPTRRGNLRRALRLDAAAYCQGGQRKLPLAKCGVRGAARVRYGSSLLPWRLDAVKPTPGGRLRQVFSRPLPTASPPSPRTLWASLDRFGIV